MPLDQHGARKHSGQVSHLLSVGFCLALGCAPAGEVGMNLPRFDSGSGVESAAADTHDNETAGSIVCPTGTAAMQADMFARRCAGAGCHGSTSPALGLDLLSPGLEARLVGAPSIGCRGEKLLVAGQPDQSELYRKVAHSQPDCGVRMPVGTPAFTDNELACLRHWILSLEPIAVRPTDAAAPGGADASSNGGDAAADASVGPICSPGQTACTGGCTDLALDNRNCGQCGKVCGVGTTCKAGGCACTAGLTACGGACV